MNAMVTVPTQRYNGWTITHPSPVRVVSYRKDIPAMVGCWCLVSFPFELKCHFSYVISLGSLPIHIIYSCSAHLYGYGRLLCCAVLLTVSLVFRIFLGWFWAHCQLDDGNGQRVTGAIEAAASSSSSILATTSRHIQLTLCVDLILVRTYRIFLLYETSTCSCSRIHTVRSPFVVTVANIFPLGIRIRVLYSWVRPTHGREIAVLSS